MLATGGLLAAVWIVSRYYIVWMWFDHGGSTTGYGIGYGMVGRKTFAYPSYDAWNSLVLNRIPTPQWSLWQWGAQPGGFTDFACSFWPAAVAAMAIGLWAGRPASRKPTMVRGGGLRIAAGLAATVSGLLVLAAGAASYWWPLDLQINAWDARWSSGLVAWMQVPGRVQSLRWRRTGKSGVPARHWIVPDLIDPPLSFDASSLKRFPPRQSASGQFTWIVKPDWNAWLAHGVNSGGWWIVEAVVWPVPALLLGIGAPVLWSGLRVRRRGVANACLTCGYSLTGIDSHAACPECGAVR
ncbi:MAG: hypothetical protein QM783_00165 [Phycisphaerales bacterium]